MRLAERNVSEFKFFCIYIISSSKVRRERGREVMSVCSNSNQVVEEWRGSFTNDISGGLVRMRLSKINGWSPKGRKLADTSMEPQQYGGYE